MVPLLASSCGGSTPPKATGPSHRVAGPGFRFAVPDGWTTTQTGSAVVARQPGEQEGPLVSATAYRLTKPYSAALFTRAARELDGVAAKLAQASGGTVTESVTTTVDGQKIRAYRFTAHPAGKPSTDDRIGFVLEGRHEYQLLCSVPAGAGDPDGACALLFGSFAAPLE
jgi:predicted Zn-dependent protease